MKHKGVFSFVLIICMFSFSLNSYAEQVNWCGDDVKTLVDIYNSIDVNSPEEWERFEDEYAVSGGRAPFFFHNSELSDFRRSNKLIKITYNQVGEPTEETNEYYERMKTDFGFYFMTDDYKEYYYGFDITKRAVFTIKDAIKGSGVSPDHISVAILLGNPYNEPFEVSTVDVIDYVKGWNRIDGKKYYIKNDGTMAIGLYKIKGVMYYFGKDGICNGKYTGFAKNSKGKWYYKNGVKVTKNTTIDGVRYKFSSDGCCKGYFTGFTRSSQGRKYWSNGILAKDKWVQDSKGNYYYAGNDGYLLTGWQKVTRIGGNYSYFYENGIWDGKVYHKRYIQNNLRAVFKDMDFLVEISFLVI